MTSLPPPTPTLPPKPSVAGWAPSASASASGHPSARPRRGVLAACYATLERLRLPNGLSLASPSADYSKAWLRDNVYEALPFVDKPTRHYERTFWTLLDILRRHEWKVDAILRGKPAAADAPGQPPERAALPPSAYVHPRYHPVTLREFDEPWGNKQNDAIGAVLFGIAEGTRHGKRILRDERDRRLVGKLVRMLDALRYWEDADNGMWEEAEEIHASSVGACLGALLALREQGFDVPDDLVQEGRWALDALLPRESATKRTDLALLSLCYPYPGVVTPQQARQIAQDVERRLLRGRGAIRYEGDSYYSTLAEEHGREQPWPFYHGTEAEWTFALPWLSIVWRDLGDPARADAYLERALAAQTRDGELPELYYSKTDLPNPNTPLGWSVAMLVLAIERAPAERG
jgi:phosphorylase kinase alpha/beta subunit